MLHDHCNNADSALTEHRECWNMLMTSQLETWRHSSANLIIQSSQFPLPMKQTTWLSVGQKTCSLYGEEEIERSREGHEGVLSWVCCGACTSWCQMMKWRRNVSLQTGSSSAPGMMSWFPWWRASAQESEQLEICELGKRYEHCYAQITWQTWSYTLLQKYVV